MKTNIQIFRYMYDIIDSYLNEDERLVLISYNIILIKNVYNVSLYLLFFVQYIHIWNYKWNYLLEDNISIYFPVKIPYRSLNREKHLRHISFKFKALYINNIDL